MTEIVGGERAPEILGRALERVTALVPYLSARVDPDLPPGTSGVGPDRRLPGEREWMTSRSLIDDPAWLGAVIRSTGTGLGTDDPLVEASLFVQGYSYRVLTLAVACLTAAGVVPDASADRMAVALDGSWPSLVAFLEPTVLVVASADELEGGADARRLDAGAVTAALRFILDSAVDRHLSPLVASVRRGLGAAVGERLLWGNVAASAATAFRTMEGCLGAWVEPFGERFFDLAPAMLQGLGSFWAVDEAGQHGWFWERTNCCLIDRLPGGVRCADCSRTPVTRRRAAYRASLGGS